jgi:hypothetical protein
MHGIIAAAKLLPAIGAIMMLTGVGFMACRRKPKPALNHDHRIKRGRPMAAFSFESCLHLRLALLRHLDRP